ATPPNGVPALHERGATFVTLIQHGELRGCVGAIDAHRSLQQDVEETTLWAAFRDPRFEPLSAAELRSTRIEVSLLTPAVPLPVDDEAELLRALRPGMDGLFI